MLIRSEKNRIKTLVIDTITLLCKNGLPAKSGFSIEGVIGVTSLEDEDDVFIIPIKEIVKHVEEHQSSGSDSDDRRISEVRKRKKKRRHSNNSFDGTDNNTHADASRHSIKSVKQEIYLDSDDNSNDIVMIKEEPSSLPSRERLSQTVSSHNVPNVVSQAACNALAHVQSYQPQPVPAHQQVPQRASWQNMPRMPAAAPMPTSSPLISHPAIKDFQLRNNFTASPEEDFSKFTHDDMKTIANRVASTEGMFLTVRLVKRRLSRYPTNFIIKTMKEYMTRSRTDPLFMGEYREPPRTKVFYKCPPELIKQEALAHINITREIYSSMYSQVPKVLKWGKPEIQGRLLISVIESSPFTSYYRFESIVEQYSKEFTGEQEPLSVSQGRVLSEKQTVPEIENTELYNDLQKVDSAKTNNATANLNESGDLYRPQDLTKSKVLEPGSTKETSSALASLYAFAGSVNDPHPYAQTDIQKQAEKAIMQTMYKIEASNSAGSESQDDG